MKEVVIDLSDKVRDAMISVNKKVGELLREYPNADFFDIFYRVHISFALLYLKGIIDSMSELARILNTVHESLGGDEHETT